MLEEKYLILVRFISCSSIHCLNDQNGPKKGFIYLIVKLTASFLLSYYSSFKNASAHHVSIISRKLEVHPIISQW